MTEPGWPGEADATFPVALRLRGRLAVVVGGGGLAARVSARLLASGARVLVVGPDPGPAVGDLGARGLVELRDRDYLPADLDGAALVLTCSARDEVNAAAAADAQARNIWSAGPPDVFAAAAVLPGPGPAAATLAAPAPTSSAPTSSGLTGPGLAAPGLTGPGPAAPGLTAPGARVLVLGGARSGKSVLAESMLADAVTVDYVATGDRPGTADAEWAERVREHRARRPPGWRTLETTDVAAVLAEPDAGTPVLVDCLATWLARAMDDSGVWTSAAEAAPALARRLDELLAAWERTSRPVVAVSNEVGSGVVPATVSGRLFRDELGRLNARLAARSEQVWLCTAGIGQRLR
ncbi:MAG: bifunctional adenosylcobinamide kinase/adenosylcobinamide-phosphate guanylyltransferase [Streptosporangiaceae bacterium]